MEFLKGLINAVLGIFTDSATLLAFCVFIISFREYNCHRKAEKSKCLSHFNSRYVKDPSIKRVIKDFTKTDSIDMANDCRETEYESRPEILNDRELFLRFFEELQYAIKTHRIDKRMVYDLFSYYAIEADRLGTAFVPDYETDSWKTFKAFVKSMKELESNKNKWSKVLTQFIQSK